MDCVTWRGKKEEKLAKGKRHGQERRRNQRNEKAERRNKGKRPKEERKEARVFSNKAAESWSERIPCKASARKAPRRARSKLVADGLKSRRLRAAIYYKRWSRPRAIVQFVYRQN